MPRPGFVLDVDQSTPATMIWRGEELTRERLPIGSRVIYAPEPVASIEDPSGAIAAALAAPIDSEPLRSRLRPGMTLTITFDDISSPLPPTRQPDSRQRVIEAVLNMAAAAGIDDVELLVARGLNRRLYESELRHTLGDRIYDSFAPKGLLKQHDAEDTDGLTLIGKTDKGEPVELNKRAVSSDLLIYVNVSTTTADGGWKGVATGLAGYKTIWVQSQTPGAVDRMSEVIDKQVEVFQIETTLNTDLFPAQLSFAAKREWEWSPQQKGAYALTRGAADLAPGRIKRRFFQSIDSPQALTGVHAGSVRAVHESTVEQLHLQQLTSVDGQSDIVSFGIPYFSPYSVHSLMNPVLVAGMTLAYMFNLYRNNPLVRKGGVAIVHHPTPPKFHPTHHPSYIDFFDQVLPESTDPSTIESKFEEKYATDAWYTHLYRTSNAYHGAHPLHLWYQCAPALAHLGGVIVVGGNHTAVRRLGFRSATTLQDALEIARDITGTTTPSLSHFHAPPIFTADVV